VTESRVSFLTFAALLVSQGFLFFLSPETLHLAILAVCLPLDGLLSALYLRTASQRKQQGLARLKRIQEALEGILELTSVQKKEWLKILDLLGGVEPEESTAAESVHQLRIKLEGMRSQLLPNRRDDSALTVESIIDGLQTVILLNHSLMTDLDTVLQFYHSTYLRLQEVRKENRLNHFRLHESVGFLDKMGKETAGYSERLVLGILDSFREVTQFSQGISTDVLGTVRRLMDSANPNGLDAINQETGAISVTLDQFFTELGKAIAFSQKTVADNLGQMGRVKVMSDAIADFSENIRMLSLNLNIEAARATQHQSGGNSGRGFQVLAVKLSEFAQKAQELAQNQQDIIGAASSIMTSSGTTQMSQLGTLMEQIPLIKQRLDPFKAIVNSTYTQFEAVVTSMEHLSQAIDSRLKAVIGKLQFQDLVRQEQEHLLAMFAHVRDLAEQVSAVDSSLAPEQKREALNDLLLYFEALATTENELVVIKEFRKSHPELTKRTEESNATAGSVSLF